MEVLLPFIVFIDFLVSSTVGWAVLARDRRLEKRQKEEGKRELEQQKVLREARQKEVLRSAWAVINTHAPTLYRKKLQKTKHDDYGNNLDSE